MKPNIKIVGAGPAGIFAAYSLADHANVTIIDKGKDIEKRACPILEKKVEECISCKPCNVHCGIGGAGLMSDGKLLFSTEIGNNLSVDNLINKQENQELVNKVEKIFTKYNITPVQENQEKLKQLKDQALQHNIEFVSSKQAHIGSDKLSKLMKQIKQDLEKKGVKFKSNKKINSLEEIKYDSVILAPGRSGSNWLEQILKENSIEYKYRPVDIGVRIEVPRETTDKITNITRDMKFYMTSEHTNDPIRTFCTCPGGRVCQETHPGFTLVNGYATSNSDSPNTNFAILTTIPLINTNSNEYAQKIAELGYILKKGNKITVQRFKDLKSGRKSKTSDNWKYHLHPTLKEAEWGDISLVLPARYYLNIVNGIEKLNKVIPGITNDSTLLYAPEMKFHGLNITTNKYLHAGKNIYIAGDGAGVSRGIVGAAASGLLAAKGILKKP